MQKVKFDDLRNDLLKDPEFKKEYDSLKENFTIAKEVIQLRHVKNLTQKQLADEIGTSQPAIARLESGEYTKLSLSFLSRVAEALDAVPEIHLRKKAHY